MRAENFNKEAAVLLVQHFRAELAHEVDVWIDSELPKHIKDAVRKDLPCVYVEASTGLGGVPFNHSQRSYLHGKLIERGFTVTDYAGRNHAVGSLHSHFEIYFK